MENDFLDKLPRPGGPTGLYIHIPFCLKKCPYCDFYSVTDLSLKDAFTEALVKEMRLYAGYVAGFDTVYIGGGTPSVLSPEEIRRILTESRRCFNILPDAELTLEVNPGTVSPGSLSAYLRCGINRINIGVQSFHDPVLGFLERIHSAEDAVNALHWARRAGFGNIGLDLIYGVRGQTAASWRADLETAAAFRPEHLSCYMLTYEKNTPFELSLRQGRFKPLTEKRVARLFIQTVQWLAQNGYVQYEISNFTQAGPGGAGSYPSRHNQKYWNFKPYLGLGPSAHSYLEPVRFWNPRNLENYIVQLNAGRLAVEDKEVLTIEQQMMESVLLGLRTAAGISMVRFSEKFKRNFLEIFKSALTGLESEGLLQLDKNRCFLTRRGMLLLDGIVDRIIGSGQERV